MKVRLKYVTNYSNDELVTKSSTVPDCLSICNTTFVYVYVKPHLGIAPLSQMHGQRLKLAGDIG